MIFIDIKKALNTVYGKSFLDVKITMEKGDFLAVLGESGSGKTTFLRVLAGLEKAEGIIKVDNEIWLDKKKFLPPQKREIGFVFQDYALFNNMSVIENLLYVNKDIEFAKKLLKLSGIESLSKRNPLTLSGGQKQRVALCRALMRKPKLLLLDEAFSALDEKRREDLQDILFYFHKEFNLTSIMVSHSTQEIYKLSNKLLRLENGKMVEFVETKNFYNLKSRDFIIKGKVLEVREVNNNFLVIISIGHQIIKQLIYKYKIKNIQQGDNVEIKFNGFNTKLKVLK